MSGRSANSVRELLGKFEENSQHVSPPSRGRSPAGSESVTSTDSRPFSKVRTSFVSVERSGQMASSLKKSSSNFEGKTGGDGQLDPDLSMNGKGMEKTTANGNGVSPRVPKDATDSSLMETEGNGAGAAEALNHIHPSNSDVPGSGNPADIDLDKVVAHVEDGTAALPSTDKPDDQALTKKGSVLERRTSLGDLLKGHAFEQETSLKPEISMSEPSKTPEIVNPDEHQLQSSTLPTDLKPKGGLSNNMSTANTRSVGNTNAQSTHISPIITTEENLKAPSSSAVAPISSTSKSSKTPKTPKDEGLSTKQPAIKPSTTTKQPIAKTSSPNQKASVKPTTKSSIEKPGRSSAVTKAHIAINSKPIQPSAITNTSPTKQTGLTSPSTTVHPKSPTRPARLRASLTAPTAASVARTGGAAPARPSSRTSHATTNKSSMLNKDRTPATTSQPRPRPSRASLPVPSTAPPNSKPRDSTTSSKSAGGGFLARMMRPTQSSASKSHEKIEAKTPPKKTVLAKPHRETKGGAVEHGALEDGESSLNTTQNAPETIHSPNTEAAHESRNAGIEPASTAAHETTGLNGDGSGINGNTAAPSEAVSA